MAEASLPQGQNQALSRRLTLALVIPVALLIVVAVLLGAQILRMTNDARWVDHSDEVVGKTNELAKQIIDQETGVRGYLVSGDVLYLQPYRLANPIAKMDELEALTQDNPAQTTRIEGVKKRYVAWTSGGGDVDHKSFEALRTPEEMKIAKREMDDVRASIDSLLAAELDIRQERTAAANASRTSTQYFFIGLFAFAAVLIVTVSRTQLTAISGTYAKALDQERETRKAIEDRDWIAAGTVKLAERLRGELSLEQLGTRALETLAPYVGATVGNFYSRDAGKWRRRAKLGTSGSLLEVDFEGTLLGRAATSQDLVHVDEVPAGYLEIESSTGKGAPGS
ncbi:MAG TPA: CHASE3 domain-containing protein, partial [Polyangiaceae bacterium]